MLHYLLMLCFLTAYSTISAMNTYGTKKRHVVLVDLTSKPIFQQPCKRPASSLQWEEKPHIKRPRTTKTSLSPEIEATLKKTYEGADGYELLVEEKKATPARKPRTKVSFNTSRPSALFMESTFSDTSNISDELSLPSTPNILYEPFFQDDTSPESIVEPEIVFPIAEQPSQKKVLSTPEKQILYKEHMAKIRRDYNRWLRRKNKKEQERINNRRKQQQEYIKKLKKDPSLNIYNIINDKNPRQHAIKRGLPPSKK